MDLQIALVALLASLYVGYNFFKAGRVKMSATRKDLLEAGFGWVAGTPMWVVKTIAWLELLGSVGIVLAPMSAYFLPGFGWARLLGYAAALGLALIMVGALALHGARRELKYTWPTNVRLLGLAVISLVLQLLVGTVPVV